MEFQKISELVKCPEFAGLPGKYRQVAAGYVAKKQYGYDYVLVGRRDNPHDPMRKGYIVLPCGGLEDGESFEGAAYREVREETDVITEMGDSMLFSCIPDGPFVKEYGPVVSVIEKNGTILCFARDSKIKLIGEAFHLIPLTEPRDMPDSDLRNPKYRDLLWLLQNQEYVMPEQHMLLDVVADRKMLRETKGKIRLDEEDLAGFIREAVSI
jgi:8-oxo-dGTP pyrophosphatase MutT (NUDIX family)